MLKLVTSTFLAVVVTIPAFAAQKFEGDTVLKDSQPAGVANKHDKHMKHQVFDLTFDAGGNEYICPHGQRQIDESYEFRRGRQHSLPDRRQEGEDHDAEQQESGVQCGASGGCSHCTQ